MYKTYKLLYTDNKLATLDVSNSPKLAELNVGSNQLTALDVTNNTRLTYLQIGSNQISSIDLSKNPLLDSFFASGNLLTSVDFSKNFVLRSLVLDSNPITSIDISKLDLLQYFYASYMPLTSIDASKNSNLIYINAVENHSMQNINFKNGYNKNVLGFFAIHSENLKCVQVDDPTYSSSQSLWQIDSTASYSTDCTLMATQDITKKYSLLYPNPTKDIIYMTDEMSEVEVYNAVGQKILDLSNTKTIDLSKYNSGVYFIQTKNKANSVITLTKVIKN